MNAPRVSLPRANVDDAVAQFKRIAIITELRQVPVSLRALLLKAAQRGQRALEYKGSGAVQNSKRSAFIREVVLLMIGEAGVPPFPAEIRKRWIASGAADPPELRTIRKHLSKLRAAGVIPPE